MSERAWNYVYVHSAPTIINLETTLLPLTSFGSDWAWLKFVIIGSDRTELILAQSDDPDLAHIDRIKFIEGATPEGQVHFLVDPVTALAYRLSARTSDTLDATIRWCVMGKKVR